MLEQSYGLNNRGIFNLAEKSATDLAVATCYRYAIFIIFSASGKFLFLKINQANMNRSLNQLYNHEVNKIKLVLRLAFLMVLFIILSLALDGGSVVQIGGGSHDLSGLVYGLILFAYITVWMIRCNLVVG